MRNKILIAVAFITSFASIAIFTSSNSYSWVVDKYGISGVVAVGEELRRKQDIDSSVNHPSKAVNLFNLLTVIARSKEIEASAQANRSLIRLAINCMISRGAECGTLESSVDQERLTVLKPEGIAVDVGKYISESVIRNRDHYSYRSTPAKWIYSWNRSDAITMVGL